MKKHRRLFGLFLFLLICGSLVWVALQTTAEYPALGEPVSYATNQLAGFDLSIEKPSWSPFKGYTIQYEIAINSEEIYTLVQGNGKFFEYLDALVDGQWYRLQTSMNFLPPNTFDLGGAMTGFYGSMVQKHSHLGTRLDPGTYRFVMELTDTQGNAHYLAEEFSVG